MDHDLQKRKCNEILKVYVTELIILCDNENNPDANLKVKLQS